MSKQIAVATEADPNESNTYQDRLAATSRTSPRTAWASPRRFITILVILLVILAAASVLLFAKYRHATADNPARKQQRLTAELGQVVELPPEQPIISTVLDKSKLSNQALASRAHDGDTLFIFPKSKRLILYRPNDKKVVDMLNIQP
jgi:hypothetical protein